MNCSGLQAHFKLVQEREPVANLELRLPVLTVTLDSDTLQSVGSEESERPEVFALTLSFKLTDGLDKNSLNNTCGRCDLFSSAIMEKWNMTITCVAVDASVYRPRIMIPILSTCHVYYRRW